MLFCASHRNNLGRSSPSGSPLSCANWTELNNYPRNLHLAPPRILDKYRAHWPHVRRWIIRILMLCWLAHKICLGAHSLVLPLPSLETRAQPLLSWLEAHSVWYLSDMSFLHIRTGREYFVLCPPSLLTRHSRRAFKPRPQTFLKASFLTHGLVPCGMSSMK